MNQQAIVFFDGYCVLCNGFVDFLIRADKRERLKLASLQGNTAEKLLPAKLIRETDTVIFKDAENQLSVKSVAVLNILNTMGGVWKIFKIFNIFPALLLDTIYDWVAGHRYGWFGKRDSCRIPTPEEKNKILD